MRIAIVLSVALLLGVVGLIGTIFVTMQIQNSSAQPTVTTGDRMRDLDNAQRAFGEAAGNMTVRNRYGMVGGVVGLVVGVGVGIVLADKLANRRKAS